LNPSRDSISIDIVKHNTGFWQANGIRQEALYIFDCPLYSTLPTVLCKKEKEKEIESTPGVEIAFAMEPKSQRDKYLHS